MGKKHESIKIKNTALKAYIRNHKRVILIAVVLILVIIAAITTFYVYRNKTTVLIGGVRVSRGTYDSIVADAAKDDSHGQVGTDRNAIIAISAQADELNKKYDLGITQSMLDGRAKTAFDEEWSQLNAWQRSFTESSLINDYAYFLSKGGYEFYLYEFPFSESYTAFPTDATKSASSAVAASQRAQTAASSLRTTLTGDTSKAESLAVDLRNNNDYKTGYGYSMNPTGWSFMTNDGTSFAQGTPAQTSYTLDKQIVDTVTSLGVNKVSDVLTRQGDVPVVPYSQPPTFQQKPVSYRVVYVTKVVAARPDLYKDLSSYINQNILKGAK